MGIGTSHVAWMLATACAFSVLMHRAGRPDMDARVSFLVLALAASVFLVALTLLLRTVRASGLRPVPRVIAVLALALVASCSALAGRVFVAWEFYWPSGQDVDGDFVVKKWSRPDMMDPGDHTIQALYFRGREVTPRLGWYRRHPTQPAVVMFVRFESYNVPVTYAFDAGTFRTLRLTSGDTMPFPDQWSPDTTRVVLFSLGDLYVFDVPRWRVSRLGGPAMPPGQVHQADLAGWSPASRRFAQIDYGMPPYPNSQPVVLREWNTETSLARTVGCMPGSRGWSRDDFSWQDESIVVAEEVRRHSTPCPDK